jgi:uncharacterized protein (TIGR04255 family)
LETNVISKGDDLPNSLDLYENWLDEAHKTTDKWFFTLVRGRLLRQFENRTDDDHDIELSA